jgi:calcineurin-like phosphoesterase family protein
MTIWIISDTHFGHKNSLKFIRADGITPLRNFSSVEEMDECMIERWNSVVRCDDTIYHLGDVVMNRRCLPIVHRLYGKKILIRGNHDTAPIKEYLEYFDEVYAEYGMNDIIMTHRPIAIQCFDRYKTNCHGHIHANSMNDLRYFNVCVECLDYTPISLEELREKIAEMQND